MSSSSSDSSPGISPLPNPGPDVDRAQEMIVLHAVGCALAIVFIALRIWCRAAIKAIGWDDWFMLAAAILNIPLTVLVIIFTVKGGTRHLFYLSQDPANAIVVIKLNWIARPFAYFGLSIGKISIAFLILRLLGHTSRWRKLSLHFINVIAAINPIIVVINDFTQCKNVEALWNPVVRSQTKCLNPGPIDSFAVFASTWNTATDFYLSFLALNLIWGIQVLTIQRKIAVCVFLGCGLVTGIVSAIKTYTLSRHRPDVTWDYFFVYIWNCVELTLLIVLGSLPTLRPLYDKVMGKRTDRESNAYYSGSFRQTGIRNSGRKRQSYEPMDSDISHPLTDLQVPERSHYEGAHHVS
ncbi:hypothetical protein DM02DRAFT_672756 [Periconia macrospinosa]|uniref:Rhodopsin domain-containing protein n=1 Tax=Periconia macrospinosa TaxID=97972 RepID=A0A2V1DMN8_9PLEO|nr:hypothetical protein DM02DRAFT_672756 [Periconia macrospinosa]